MKESAIFEDEFMFKDYTITKRVYHIAPLIKLKEILEIGLKISESCSSKYDDFNTFFDKCKPNRIPEWVSRKKAIYGSLNFTRNHKWHSHSVILSLKIDEQRCWIGDESLANILYEPFILRDISIFSEVDKFFKSCGEQFALDYWENSTCFMDNLIKRFDRDKEYDAEVLIMHDIPPMDINIIKIISDHKAMDINQCNNVFKSLTQI